MAALEVMLGGILAAGGGALVAWLNSASVRRERLAARRDALNREAVDAAAQAETAVGEADPAVLTLFVTALQEGEHDDQAQTIVERSNAAAAALTRVAVGHDDDGVANQAREARTLLVQAVNRSLRLRQSVRTHSTMHGDFNKAEERLESAMAAVRSLQEAIRGSMDRDRNR